jgi:hypothetical protein
MRKILICVLGLAVALGSAAVAMAVPNTQTIDGTVKPKKLPKKGKAAPIKLVVDVSASNSGNPNSVPFPTTRARVDFDKDVKYQQKGYPTCDFSGFSAATTTTAAKDECGDAQIGTGGANVQVPTGAGAPPIQVPAQVTVFNGKGKGIILFTSNTLSGGTVLPGKIKKSDAGGPYGVMLDVTVPPLAGGAAVIQQFDATVKKTYRSGGKKRSILSSTCKDKKIKFQARFTDNQGQLASGTDTFKCTQKGS